MEQIKIKVKFEHQSGTTENNFEIEIPSDVAQRMWDSSSKERVIGFLQGALPEKIGVVNWRQNKWEILSYRKG